MEKAVKFQVMVLREILCIDGRNLPEYEVFLKRAETTGEN
jgi:hypothetical protein